MSFADAVKLSFNVTYRKNTAKQIKACCDFHHLHVVAGKTNHFSSRRFEMVASFYICQVTNGLKILMNGYILK